MMNFLGITPAHVLVELLQRRKDEKLQNHVRNKTNEKGDRRTKKEHTLFVAAMAMLSSYGCQLM